MNRAMNRPFPPTWMLLVAWWMLLVIPLVLVAVSLD